MPKLQRALVGYARETAYRLAVLLKMALSVRCRNDDFLVFRNLTRYCTKLQKGKQINSLTFD